MEKERAHTSVEFLTYERAYVLQRGAGRISAIEFLAALMAVGLIGSLLYRSSETISVSNTVPRTLASVQHTSPQFDPSIIPDYGTSSPGVFSSYTNIGSQAVSEIVNTYANLQKTKAYTPEAGVQVGEQVARDIVHDIPATTFSISSLHIDSDSSKERVSTYRSDLQGALQPLLKNTEAEYVVYGRYVQTGDAHNLSELQTYADNYRAAAQNLATLSVPQSAVIYHIALMNALTKFAATLDTMAQSAADPIASATLLVNYNDAEGGVQSAFGSLVSYFKQNLL